MLMDQEKSTTSSEPPVNSLSTAQPLVRDLKGPARATARPLYSSRLDAAKAKSPPTSTSYAPSPTTRQSPAPQQRAWARTSPKISSRSNSPQQKQPDSPALEPALNSFFNRVKEGQRVQLTVKDGAEFEDIYANSPLDSTSRCHSRMVQSKKSGPADTMNGSGKRQSAMPYTRGNMKSHGGNRSSFQTDTGISGGRLGEKRELQRWDAGGSSNGGLDGGLEDTKDNNKPWDQFAVNEEKFGVQTDYDESIYTTSIDRSRPDYNQKVARAEKLARRIEGTTANSAHAAEERIVDHVGGADDGMDEEDKYSGVKRGDFPPLASQNSNKYTPPARRAPTGQATVKGAPVDPAIISSQLRATPGKQTVQKPEEAKGPVASSNKANADVQKTDAKASESTAKEELKPTDTPAPAPVPATAANKSQSDTKPAEKPGTAALRASVNATRMGSPAAKENQPIEKEVLKEFKSFAQKQREGQREKAEDAKKKKLNELKNFASSFKLGTPVPNDLIGIIAKDPKKQQEIQEKARKNAEEVQRAKEESKKVEPTVKEQGAASAKSQAKTEPAASSSATGTPANAADSRGSSRAGGAPQHANSGGAAPRNRQSYAPGSYQQQLRNDRTSGQNLPRHIQQGGHTTPHLRNGEQQRMSQQPHRMTPDMRIPPTGPASTMGPPFVPRHSLPPNHMGPGPRLNPSTQEFRPNAQPFYPTGPSATSSPRSALNNVESSAASAGGAVIRRKIKSIDLEKCFILSHVQTIKPPTANNRAWEENGGLRPPFDSQPTWKPVREEDNKDKISYKQLFERPPYAGAMATPNTAPVVPQMPHQHQLPFHLQQGAQNAGPRQSPHMPPMQMHAGHPGHVPHMPFNNGDDGTRMMHSNSAQSYASPRPGQVPMAYPNMMNSPSHMPYSQPVMPGFMGPGAQMAPQMRNFQQNPQYMPQQQPGQMGPPMMMGPGYMAGPAPMMQGTPQMPMAYPGAHPNFVPPGPVPPQAMQGANGYPSPGRPAAPMMAHQGSQQGQHMYGMNSGTMPQYQQPSFPPQQPGQMGNMRVHGNPGPQQLGTSPQQMHQYGPHQNRGSNYGGKNFSGPHHGPPNHNGPAGAQTRAPDSQEEAK